MIRTVSALLYTYDDEVLLHKHKKLGKYMGFGGKVSHDESEINAIHREVYEETGLYVPFLLEIVDDDRTRVRLPSDVVVIQPRGEEQILDHTYFILVNRKIRNQELKKEDESIDSGWFDIKYAINNLDMFPDTREQLGRIRRIFNAMEDEG